MSLENVLKPFHNEGQVRVGEETLRLVIDFRTIDVIEGLLGKGMNQVLTEIMVPEPPHGPVGKVLFAMTREHHPELTMDQIAGLLYSKEHGPPVGIVCHEILTRAFHLDEPEGKKGSRPPRRSRGASRPSSRNGPRRG